MPLRAPWIAAHAPEWSPKNGNALVVPSPLGIARSPVPGMPRQPGVRYNAVAAGVAKWQTQRTQNPPGKPVGVRISPSAPVQGKTLAKAGVSLCPFSHRRHLAHIAALCSQSGCDHRCIECIDNLTPHLRTCVTIAVDRKTRVPVTQLLMSGTRSPHISETSSRARPASIRPCAQPRLAHVWHQRFPARSTIR